jgi:uncharacterized protein (TIGR00730 family)
MHSISSGRPARNLALNPLQSQPVFSARRSRTSTKALPRENGVLVYSSYRGNPGEPLYELAKEVGRQIGSAFKNNQRLFVVTGGGGGLMGATAEGAIEVGSSAVGVGIPFGDEPLPKHLYTEYTEHPNFPLRLYGKGGFEHRAAYTVALPGGIGTEHEFKTKGVELHYNHTMDSSQKQIVLLDHDNFFTAPGGQLEHIRYLIQKNMTDPAYLNIFKVVKTPEEVVKALLDPTVPWTKPAQGGFGVRGVRLNKIG